jgi:2,4-diaminopentanoate dehydrogenase
VIEGTPSIDSSIKGGVNGDVATCAILVNAIPAVVNARPGLRTMVDIEPPHCFQ